MRTIRKYLQQNQWVKPGFWLALCFSLVLSSFSENQPEQTEIEPTNEPEIVFTLPKEIVSISNMDLGIASISGIINEENLNWEDQYMSQYAVLLVDAKPFLTMQADMSDLQVYEAVLLLDDGFEIDLPQKPAAENSMQIMMLAVEDKDCLISGNQLISCWDAELSSIAFEDASQSVVVDGQLLVWAADDGQSFPDSIGADGMFFTDDDELLTLEPGYTLIDLGTKPFTFEHQAGGEIALYSNYDPSTRDLSELTYTEAFDHIFNDMREGYAFNGVEGKEPDWDAVYELIYPQVQAAEKSGDVNDWISALNAFTQQFSDSHVSVSGEAVNDWVDEKYSHGYIFYFDLLSNGDIVYTNGPVADMEWERFDYYFWGYKLVEIYKTPVEDKINEILPVFGSYSSPEMYYRAQVRDMTHTLTEKIPKFGLKEFDGYVFEDRRKPADENVISAENEYEISYDPSQPISVFQSYPGIGIITIHTDGHNMQTALDIFDESLAEFENLNVDTIIIDLRDSEEYRFMNYAGYFSDTSMELGEMAWRQFGDLEGKMRTQALQSIPNKHQYSFDKIAVLTDERCKDACEADVYALSQLPQTTVYGETPTFGSFSIVGSTPYTLPDNIAFNYSSGNIHDENGNLLIEGTGVPFNIQIEETQSTFLLDYDWQILLLHNMLVFADEMNIVPDTIPQPLELSEEEADEIIDEFYQRDIEQLSIDEYALSYMPINYSYRVFLLDPGKEIISRKWCTTVPDLSLYKGEEMNFDFIVDGQHIDENYFKVRIMNKGPYKCWVKFAVLDNWEPGVHHMKIDTNIFGRLVYDGGNWYDQGDYSEEYTIVVKESE
jgi:hypothetical protein